MERPNWDDYFLGMAIAASCRSIDENTHHGCILVNDENVIIATGYNGFVRGIDDDTLPKNRDVLDSNNKPAKYKWMLHAEKNALLTATGKATRCYVTGKCCLSCLQDLAQFGVKEIVMFDGYGWSADREQEDDWNLFVKLKNLKVRFIKPNLDYLKKEITKYE